jgi:hypothetical protein
MAIQIDSVWTMFSGPNSAFYLHRLNVDFIAIRSDDYIVEFFGCGKLPTLVLRLDSVLSPVSFSEGNSTRV